MRRRFLLLRHHVGRRTGRHGRRAGAPAGYVVHTYADVTKLTPLSPEVIRNQATINIGTIGHVDHGKTTLLDAMTPMSPGRQETYLLTSLRSTRFHLLEKLDSIKPEVKTLPLRSTAPDVPAPLEFG